MVDDRGEGICDARGDGLVDPLKGCTFLMDPFRVERDQVVNLIQTLKIQKIRLNV